MSTIAKRMSSKVTSRPFNGVCVTTIATFRDQYKPQVVNRCASTLIGYPDIRENAMVHSFTLHKAPICTKIPVECGITSKFYQ